MPPDDHVTREEAADLTAAFFGAADAIAAGDRDRAADLLVGERCDDTAMLRRMFALYAIGALIAGRSVRRHLGGGMLDPDDTVGIEMINGETGQRVDPDEVPPSLRLVMWSVTAGANLDDGAIAIHLRNLTRHHGYQGVCDGVLIFAQVTASPRTLTI